MRRAPPPPPPPPPTARPSGDNYTDTLRRLLGAEYELLAPIGEGGFARVYKARDRRLDRIVAIKVIRPDMAGAAAFVESFRHEGIALAKLRHPGIVPIYDIRESEGLIYYVMPLVEGETLGQKLQRLLRLPPSETQRILTELCDALGAAHRAKMVHRDIKPANVILEGNLEKALLMDFGIAKALTDEVKEAGAEAEPVVGTPQYMSPEQVAGWEEIDHRSDIYSLGVMAYRMLTGKLPFDGESPQEILEKHIKEKPVHIRRVNTSVPKKFADAIMRCLEKDPWDRFSTTMELWSELQNVSFFPTNTEIKPSSPRPGTPIKVVAGIAAIGLIAGFMTSRVVYRSAPAPPPPSNSAAEALVSGWLETMDGSDTSAFEPRAIVMHMAIDSETSSSQLSPRRLPQYGAITNRLAGVVDHPLEVLRFGNVAIVSGSYGTQEPACGKAWFTLRSRGDAWRIMHLRLQDVAGECEPAFMSAANNR